MITYYLERKFFLSEKTVGMLHTSNASFFTMEDKVREVPGRPVVEWKVPKMTAIPTGTYPLIIDMSQRFGKLMPHIMDVEGFTGVRIHTGNTEKDTEGCILVGMGFNESTLAITDSRTAFSRFMAELEDLYDANIPVQIEVNGLPA